MGNTAHSSIASNTAAGVLFRREGVDYMVFLRMLGKVGRCRRIVAGSVLVAQCLIGIFPYRSISYVFVLLYQQLLRANICLC